MDSTELQGNKESETNNQLLNLSEIIYFKSVLKLYKFVLLVPEIHIIAFLNFFLSKKIFLFHFYLLSPVQIRRFKL